MPDVFTKEERSQIMAAVHAKNTSPELRVRSLIHKLGYRFRLHKKELPGNPDIVLPRHKKIIFVHGCFWHQHEGCKYADRPSSNTDYWHKKLERNKERDQQNQEKLKNLGWNILIIWECETKNQANLARILECFLKD